MKHLLRLLFVLTILPIGLRAQFAYVLDQTIPVEDEKSVALKSPWTGGLNAAQYNTMDLNNDGIEDLVLFDRMAGKIITFLNQDNTYQYAPGYEHFFPQVTNWLLLRDFNCDGKKDLFTGDVLGMKVHTNISQGETIAWEHFLFYSDGGQKSDVLLTKGFRDKINLYLQFDDLPSIGDIDGDGDLDIFSIAFSTNGALEFHKNFSMERYGTCDSLDFERITQRWGDFTECDCGTFAYNGDDCTSSGGRTKHAGGKSLLVFDQDGDNDPDVLISEAECTTLSLLENKGSSVTDPVINSASFFPSSSPVNFSLYPAAYYEDVDFDGKKDLIATPNIFLKTAPNVFNTNLKESNWLYRNVGSTTHPEFLLAKKNFLQEDMLDVGDNAVPAFADHDGDGDLDLFISQNNFPATIHLYENVGTRRKPSFRFSTDDYNGLSLSSFYNLKIQFADVNRDGRIDLAFTATHLDGVTRLYYQVNQQASGLNFSGQPPQATAFILASTENLLLTNIDRDDNVDLLLGKSNGALEYWRNTGSLSFNREEPNYLGINASVIRQNLAAAIADLDADGKNDIILADQTGQIQVISNFRENTITQAVTNVVFNPVTNTYEAPNLGGRLWPVAVNLFDTNRPSVVVGTVLGGLRILRHDDAGALPGNAVIGVFPNPVRRSEILNIIIDRPAKAQIFSSTGHEITPGILLQPNALTPVQLPYLSAGIYILRFTTNDKSYARKFVIY